MYCYHSNCYFKLLLTISESPKVALGLRFLPILYIFGDYIVFWRQVPLVEESDSLLIISDTPVSLPLRRLKTLSCH
jgi:hypothetical protein